jgi:hypothetical protein
MVALPERFDPTLAALDREMERRGEMQPRRTYLGASLIGHACERFIWYAIRPDTPRRPFDAATLRRFEDGHRSEDVLIQRLRLVPGVELETHDALGNQFGFSDMDGMFRGHVDGLVRGLLQAPKTEHVFEAKCVSEKRFAEFGKAVDKVGEKAALLEWDPGYWAQAQVYMHYFDLTRHYLVVMSAGARSHASCRTEVDSEAGKQLREKARRIIQAESPPARISERIEFFKCKFCDFQGVCHAAA